VVTPPVSSVSWQQSHRIIWSRYPRIDLFEDIADPADWELIASAETKTNPRFREQIGNLSLVRVERRVSGYSAQFAMAPFTHVSRDRPSRFSDGSYGIYYCGDRFEVALMETVHHFTRFMRRTDEPAADGQFRELVAGIGGRLHDLRRGSFDECLAPDDYRPGQALGAALRNDGSDGIIYPSVRWPAGEAAALFWPDLIRLPINQAQHLQYHWDGTAVTKYFIIGEEKWRDLPLVA
jgi:hypothetical protein